MTIEEIKSAVDSGKTVKCGRGGLYTVIKDNLGQYLIGFNLDAFGRSENWVGLHGMKGTKYENQLNQSDFYVA